MDDRYLRIGNRGRRIPGWECFNFLRISEDMGMRPHHLSRIVRGHAGTRLGTLRALGGLLDMPLVEVVRRIEEGRQPR